MSRESTWKILIALLVWATLTIAAPWRWCRTVYECGLFLAAGNLFWLHRNEPRRLLSGALLLAGPVLIGTVQLLTGSTVSRLDTAEAVTAWVASFAVAFIARHALAHTALRHRFLTAAALAGGLTALICLIQMPLRGSHWPGGFTVPDFDLFAGPFQNRNTYAAFAELLLPVAIWKAINSKQSAWFWWAMAALLPASVIATGSRAGSLLILCEMGTLLLVQIRAKILFPLTGVAIAVMATGWDTLADRLSHEDWTSHRQQLYSSAGAMIAERPASGHGLGTFETAYPRFATFDVGRRVNHAHNDWLEWTAEGGWPLPAFLLAFFGLAAWNARRHLWSWGIAFVLAHSMVDYPLQRAGLSGWFWALGGSVLAAAAGERRNPRRRSSHRSSSSPGAATPPASTEGSPHHAPEPVAQKDRSLTTTAR